MKELLEEYALQILAACMVMNVLAASFAAYQGRLGAVAFNLAIYSYNATAFYRAGRRKGLFA